MTLTMRDSPSNPSPKPTSTDASPLPRLASLVYLLTDLSGQEAFDAAQAAIDRRCNANADSGYPRRLQTQLNEIIDLLVDAITAPTSAQAETGCTDDNDSI